MKRVFFGNGNTRMRKRASVKRRIGGCMCFSVLLSFLFSGSATVVEPKLPARPSKSVRLRHYEPKIKRWHVPHRVKSWVTIFEGVRYRVTQLPRCEHIETVITYNPFGETLGDAKRRVGGIASCTGSFHNPRTMALADFLQKKGSVISGARTGRPFLMIKANGRLDISRNYPWVKKKPGISAIALGQRLIPLECDGFSVGFMNRVTDRMAIGLTDYSVYLVQGQSDIWRLADFMEYKLRCKEAVNSDGGHVLRGTAPVHIVFRWRKATLGHGDAVTRGGEFESRQPRQKQTCTFIRKGSDT